MTSDESATTGEVSRRLLLRGGLLAGAGAAAVIGLTSISLAGSAQAAPASRARLNSSAALVPTADAPVQWNWAWCSKCQGFWYNRPASKCPAGGTHGGKPSYNYGVEYEASLGGNYQAGWSYCIQCAGLFFSQYASTAGACPALKGTGPHLETNSYPYSVPVTSGAFNNAQAGWLWCSQCAGMWYGPKAYRGGVCPLNGSVFSHNGTKSLPYEMFDNPR